MSTESSDRPVRRTPRFVPIYLPGSSVPRLEWVDGPPVPRDWCAFAASTYLPRVWDVDVESAESVEQWRRASAAYMAELERLRAEWEEFERAVGAGRASVTRAQLDEWPRIRDLFDGYEAEIAENRQLLAAFAEMTLEEMLDVEDDVQRLVDDE